MTDRYEICLADETIEYADTLDEAWEIWEKLREEAPGYYTIYDNLTGQWVAASL